MRRAHHVCFLGLSLLLCGCKVSEPSPLERTVVVAAEHDITVGNRSQKNPLPLNERNSGGGQGSLWSLLRRLPRTRWPDHRRPIRRPHVSADPVVGFAASTGLQRRTVEMDYRQRAGTFRHAGFERHAERRGDLVDRPLSSSFAAGGQPWRTRRCTATKQIDEPEMVMKWSGRANRKVVEAVVATFHDSAEEVCSPSIGVEARDWQRSYHWLDASGMALYFLDQVESLHIESALPAATLATASRQSRRQPASEAPTMFAEFASLEPVVPGGRPGIRKSQGFHAFP